MANHPLKSSGVAKSWLHRHAGMQTNSLDKREPSSEPEMLFFQSPRLDLQLVLFLCCFQCFECIARQAVRAVPGYTACTGGMLQAVGWKLVRPVGA
eukprot:460911-Rhodomonas_salina.1